jgi:hypothetical protein
VSPRGGGMKEPPRAGSDASLTAVGGEGEGGGGSLPGGAQALGAGGHVPAAWRCAGRPPAPPSSRLPIGTI